ncbi:hypothetical protein PsorP6_005003 [Peronosclerospora sorghi]|uniref:Uncharacterized protein n=1 Tax=Peronosclerospora sorghi TaxID=230839 RepID=A0ACC0W247_9STRA|nr:hypothetical protein PsorP6_005003 [Peronosclerospora sorghi]
MNANKLTTTALRRRKEQVRAASEELAAQSSQHVPQLVIRGNSHGGEKLQVAMGGTAIERSMVNVGSLTVYHVKPVMSTDNKLGKKSTIFAVHVQNAITGRSWVVHRRYADFMMLRGLICEHFKFFGDEFPRISSLVDELYFPRKHKFRHKMGKVVEHRCDAFLEFLVGLHRLLISQAYLARRDICPIGLSILRGFLGSAIVQDSSHRAYSFHKPILPIELKPSERTPINQCGSLTTVIEDDAEYEVEIGEVDAESDAGILSHDESIDGSLSDGMSDGEDTEEELLRMSEIVDRRRSHKYARNRRVLNFLRKDVAFVDVESPTAVDQEDHPLCTPRPGNQLHPPMTYERPSEMPRRFETDHAPETSTPTLT